MDTHPACGIFCNLSSCEFGRRLYFSRKNTTHTLHSLICVQEVNKKVLLFKKPELMKKIDDGKIIERCYNISSCAAIKK